MSIEIAYQFHNSFKKSNRIHPNSIYLVFLTHADKLKILSSKLK